MTAKTPSLISSITTLPRAKNDMAYREALNDCVAIIRERFASEDVIDTVADAIRVAVCEGKKMTLLPSTADRAAKAALKAVMGDL